MERVTRRRFLEMMAALTVGAVVSACGRAIPTSPAPAIWQPSSVPDLHPTETRQPTARPTLTPSPTETKPPLGNAGSSTPRGNAGSSTPLGEAESNASATSTPLAPDFVTVRGDQFYYRGARFPIKGFNYYPRLHPWRTFNLGEWDPRAAGSELALGVSLGANTVRIVIDYEFSLQESKAAQPRDNYFAPVGQYVANIRDFLDIAGRLDLKVIFTLFDSLDWSFYLPQNQWIAEEYLKELVPPFANDPRILCWDLQNEPDRAIALVGNSAVIPFFQRMANLVRQMSPKNLQTIGWIDRARGRYFPDLDYALDFWCFHFYDTPDRLGDLIQGYKTKTGKPVLLEEFGLATGGPGPDGAHTDADQAAHYNRILSTLEENGTCGSVFWILTDFPIGLAGNPPSPDDSPENHYGVFRTDYSGKPVADEIRKFWKPQGSMPRVGL